MTSVICAAVIAAGCATQGDLNLIHGAMPMRDGSTQKFTIGDHPQDVPDWMLDPDKLKFNFMVVGDVDDITLMQISAGEKACRVYTHDVRPGRLVAVLSQGILYAGAGFLGEYTGATAFEGAKLLSYGEFGAASAGALGLANGIISLGGATYTFENCGQNLFSLLKIDVRILQKSSN